MGIGEQYEFEKTGRILPEPTRPLKRNWVAFWFEANEAWGKIDSSEEWERIKKAYDYNLELLSSCRLARPGSIGLPNYGLYSEHTGKDTLGEFFKRNNMKM